MSQTSINPTVILNELNSNEVKSLFEHLKMFTENLEEKNDPDPIEMQLVDASYQVMEKIQIFESVMKMYTDQSRSDLLGNQLQRLYDTDKSRGTSTLFK